MKSLASKVKSLALASRPQVLESWPVLGSRTALFFELLKFRGDRLKNFCEDLFFFFFWRALALVSLVLGLGLEDSCPWLRECLSSERLSLALASDFFVFLASSLVSTTPPLVNVPQHDLLLSCFFGWQTSELPGPFYFQAQLKTDLNACNLLKVFE